MADRYEPLPGVLQLPGWLFRRLSRRGQVVAGTLIALALAGIVVGTVLLVPVITESKRETAERERRERAEARRERVAKLTREQRPRTGVLGGPQQPGEAMTALEARIAGDAATRVRSGELPTPVKRVDCKQLHGARDVLLACVAVTSDIPGGEVSRGGRIGYPYRVRVNLDTGRYAFCRQAGAPGEGSLGTGVRVPLSPSCGG